MSAKSVSIFQPSVLCLGLMVAALSIGCASAPFVFRPQPVTETFAADKEAVFHASARALQTMGYHVKLSQPARGRLEGLTSHESGHSGTHQQRAVVNINEADPQGIAVSIWFSRLEEIEGRFQNERAQEIYLRDSPNTELFFELLLDRLEQNPG